MTEVFPKAFYEVVPDGVVLSLLTVQHLGFSPEAMARIHEEIMSHARAFARARCSVIFLGGAPTNLAHGWEHLRRVLRELEAEFGVPVTSNATAQNKALAALGGRKVGVVHPYKGMTGLHDQQISDAGMALAGYFSGGVAPEDYHLIPTQQAFDWGLELKRAHPDIDTHLLRLPALERDRRDRAARTGIEDQCRGRRPSRDLGRPAPRRHRRPHRRLWTAAARALKQ